MPFISQNTNHNMQQKRRNANNINNQRKTRDMKKISGYIKNIEEAMLIIHAIRTEVFEPARDRLSLEERDEIRSGSIFCFIESEEGMKRWTDGKIWSPSKIVGHFLLYKEVPRHLSKSALKKEKRVNDAHRKRLSYFPYENNNNNDFDEDFTLFKKTISIIHEDVSYHVIAYYRPFFENKSLTSIGFFSDLQKCINLNPILTNDKFIQEAKKNNRDIHREFNIPVATEENVLPPIDRAELEKMAVHVLASQLRPNYMQKEA